MVYPYARKGGHSSEAVRSKPRNSPPEPPQQCHSHSGIQNNARDNPGFARRTDAVLRRELNHRRTPSCKSHSESSFRPYPLLRCRLHRCLGPLCQRGVRNTLRGCRYGLCRLLWELPHQLYEAVHLQTGEPQPVPCRLQAEVCFWSVCPSHLQDPAGTAARRIQSLESQGLVDGGGLQHRHGVPCEDLSL